MAKQPIQLPPRDNPAAIISWFTERYQGSMLDQHVAYLNHIMEQKRLHIKDVKVGTVITGAQGSWTVAVPTGTKSYDAKFSPKFSPDVLIRLGVFGGLAIKGIETEIPIEWIIFALLSDKITYEDLPDQTKNYYQILSEPYPSTRSYDTRQFFHWFCRYYLGKRSPEDVLMIQAWRVKDATCSALMKSKQMASLVTQQTLLQWSLTLAP